MDNRIVGTLSSCIVAVMLSSSGADVLPDAEWEIVPGDLPAQMERIVIPLSHGRALLTGWEDDGSPSAYLYDPWTGVQRVADPPPLSNHFGAPLYEGRAALVGGGWYQDVNGPTDRCYVYDPDVDSWDEVARLPKKTFDYYANLAATLPDGRVIVTGGSTPDDKYADYVFYPEDPNAPPEPYSLYFGSRNVFLFDPHGETTDPDGTARPGSWSAGQKMPAIRRFMRTGPPSAFIFDWAARPFIALGIPLPANMQGIQVGRVTHHTVVLPDGRVLLIGGRVTQPDWYYGLTEVDLYDPTLDEWTRLKDMPAVHDDGDRGHGGRDFPGVSLLANGEVLIYGGVAVKFADGGAANGQVWFPKHWALRGSALVLNPEANEWRRVGDLNVARTFPLAAAWPPGVGTFAFAIGGETWSDTVAPAEVYDSTSETWALLPAEPDVSSNEGHWGAGLTDGTVLTWSMKGNGSVVKRLHPAGLPVD